MYVLLPNEDKIAMLVDSLKERLEEKHVSQTFLDSLFGNEIDEDRADEVFDQLNKTDFILENGVQLAFVIKYVQDSKQKKNILCSVHDAASTPQSHSISYNWYINGEIFNDSTHILATKYQDIAKYLTLPYTEADAKWFIKKNVDDFKAFIEKLNVEYTDRNGERYSNSQEVTYNSSNEEAQVAKDLEDNDLGF